MRSNKVIQIGNSRLAVTAEASEACIVGTFRGYADDGALNTLLEAAELLVSAAQARVVLELHDVRCATGRCVDALARMIREIHRAGKECTLVRCGDWLYGQLASFGMGGPVRHAGSLAAATEGLIGDEQAAWSLCVRSAPENLRRLRSVMNVLALRLTLSEEEFQQVQTAVGEACTNAITHGSPHGPRNSITVSFHVNPDALVVDVADEGPGFDIERVPEPRPEALAEHGYGIHLMRQMMDRLECFRDHGGTVVRLTKYLPQAAAA